MSATGQKTQTVRKPPGETADRRSARTRRMIKDALADLMHGMRYDRITVQDIIDRANIGRSTFYAHYQDKDDLATQFFEERLASLSPSAEPDSGRGSMAFPIADLLRHFQEQSSAHSAWMDSRGRDFLFSVGQKYWRRRIEREIKARVPRNRTPRVPPAVAAQMLIGAATSLLQWWLTNKMPYSPEEMQEMFDRMMLPGVRVAISPD